MQTLQDVKTWRGATLVDNDGDKIGTIEDIYLDRQSGDPEWVTVKTGLFGTKSSFVPIGEARSAGGDEVRVPYTKDQVKDAPRIEPDGELSKEEERQLYQHYGRSDYTDWSGDDRTGDRDDVEEDRSRSSEDTVGGRVGRADDDAMTRSEEELEVGTERQAAGRARLRKYVVTEDVEQTVPVQRDTARVEHEPITDDNVDAAMAGPEITESEHEVTLHEEEPVVEKRTVPKERVRLEKDTATEERTVSEQVRKERIEPEGDA
jgi:uncharacterized protein (TIGR02271 family)